MSGDETIDPRFEKLIALLYGELSEEETVSVRRMIDQDPALRAEWDDLSAARGALGTWQIEEREPEFTVPFLAPRVQGGADDRRSAGSRTERARPAWVRALTTPAWGLAAAAAVVLALAMNGFRVERLESGFAFRFGKTPPTGSESPIALNTPTTTLSTSPFNTASSTTPETNALNPGPAASLREPGPTPAGNGASGRESGATPASAGGAAASGADAPYITRQEFQSYSEGLTRTLVALLNDYSNKQNTDITGALTSMYTNLNTKQERGYDDLKGRIDQIGVGLLVEQSKTNVRIDDLLDKNAGEPLSSPRGARPDSTEEKTNDQKPR